MQGRILVTGPARSGTSLMLFLMKYISNCLVYDLNEMHPFTYNLTAHSSIMDLLPHYRYFVIKQPFGFEVWNPMYSFQDLIDNEWQIICTMRDPRDVATSHHAAYEDIQYFWRDYSWIRSAKEVLKWDGHYNVCIIKYEDLVINTIDHLRNIADMLKEEVISGYRKFYKDTTLNLDVWKCFNGIRPINNNNVGRWKDPKYFDYLRKEMTPEIRDLATRLGYTEDWDLLF